ncbi:MAG: diguanylate cyclase [Kiritimatiellae bacterium]|nr:diguanylate cyclase [Kiritimatiellia bacterium]
MPEWLIILGQTLLVAAVSCAALAVLVSHLRFQAMTYRARAVKSPGPAARSAFELRITQQLATAHRDPAPFLIARVALTNWTQLGELHGAQALAELMAAVEKRLKENIRASDVALRLTDDEVGLLLRAGRAAGEKTLKRLLEALSATPITLASGLSIRVDALAGVASHPEDGDRATSLCEKAEIALRNAREKGRGWAWANDAVVPREAAAVSDGDAEEGAPLLDELTGVLRADRVEMALQRFVATRRRDDLPVAVLVFDIDALRRYNQQYGRGTGDALLRGVAQFLQSQSRQRDLIGRLGEDQFVLVLDCGADAALAVAQRLWSAIRKVPLGPSALRITITIGVAAWPEHSGHARGLLEDAQLALRVGKEKGRNQCVLFDRAMRQLKAASAPTESF